MTKKQKIPEVAVEIIPHRELQARNVVYRVYWLDSDCPCWTTCSGDDLGFVTTREWTAEQCWVAEYHRQTDSRVYEMMHVLEYRNGRPVH